MIDIATTVSLHQGGIARQCGGYPDLLRSPVEVDANRVTGKNHERPHTRVRIVRALGMRIAAGCRAERKQRWTITSVAPDRQSGFNDEAETVAKRMQPLDAWFVVHHAEGVAGDIELSAV